MKRYSPEEVIIGYRCDSCNGAIALRFKVYAAYGNSYASLSDEYDELERPVLPFEHKYLPNPLGDDFREALVCLSQGCPNATAAMCRRTVQSIATDLGASGTAKVERQLLEAQEASGLEEDLFQALRETIIGGHDGAHPHLPPVTIERAALLVEVLKDVLYQLYVRKGKIKEVAALRDDAIAEKRNK